jgi:type IV secretion system protein VirB10
MNSVNATPPTAAVEHPDTSSPDAPLPQDDIVSVNSKSAGASNNRAAKALFVIFAGALLVGLLAWYGQAWLTSKKNNMRSGPNKTTEESANIMNPEAARTTTVQAKVGAAGDKPPPPAPADPRSAFADAGAAIRPLRGADGKIMVNAQGRALGVDATGNIVEVPAITAIQGDATPGKKALPESARNSAGQGANGVNGGNAPPKPPSRFGGSLFIDGTGVSSTSGGASGGPATPASVNQAAIDALRSIESKMNPPATPGRALSPVNYIGNPSFPTGNDANFPPGLGASPATAGVAGASAARPTAAALANTVGAQLVSSATPVARAKRFPDQNLILPKNRQMDCVLTGRIVDEVAGFTSCALTQNLYSDNGRVLLLERGSELSGEYGSGYQAGTRRLFVTWNRVKTPDGIEVDMSSPGTDALGTSGVPGDLDNRWTERVGAALLLSVIKDVAVAVIAKQTSGNTGSTINVQQPGQNTQQGAFSIADEVVRQTIKVKPTLTINEGERIAITVARDLDFSPVYALRNSGGTGSVRLN